MIAVSMTTVLAPGPGLHVHGSLLVRLYPESMGTRRRCGGADHVPPRRQVARLSGALDPALGEGTLLIQEEAEQGASCRESAPHEVSPSRQQQ